MTAPPTLDFFNFYTCLPRAPSKKVEVSLPSIGSHGLPICEFLLSKLGFFISALCLSYFGGSGLSCGLNILPDLKRVQFNFVKSLFNIFLSPSHAEPETRSYTYCFKLLNLW